MLATIFGIAPPRVIFAGFASSALWLAVGGLVIGAAVQTTGLGRRLGRLPADYRRIVYGSVGPAGSRSGRRSSACCPGSG